MTYTTTDRISRGANLTGAEGVVWYCKECSDVDGTVGGSCMQYEARAEVAPGARIEDVDWDEVGRVMNDTVDAQIAAHLAEAHPTVPEFYYVETDDGLAHAFRPAAMIARCGATFTGGRGATEPTCIDCGAVVEEYEEADDITMTEHDWSDRADALRSWMGG